MTISLQAPDIRELKPRITVFGCGGAGGNAVNNMIECGLAGVDFVVANTDAQALRLSRADRRIQMGVQVTEGLGAGSMPEVGRSAAEEVLDEIRDQLNGSHMAFITAGMGGGTGTGAAPVIARAAREMGILTVGVVTKPFHFEGPRRMAVAEAGIAELQSSVDTLIVIPNQNLFRIANDKTTFAEAFSMADQVLYSGVASITDLIVKPGLINLDFADVRAVMREMGKAMMGTGESTGEGRAIHAAEAAIANPLLDEVSMKGARGLLISITGGRDMKIYEVDEAANRIRQEVEADANVIFGATQDESLDGIIRVSVVATGLDRSPKEVEQTRSQDQRLQEMAEKLRAHMAARAQVQQPATRIEAPVAAAETMMTPQPEPVRVQHDVTIQPVAPRPVYVPEPVVEQAPAPQFAPASHFIPPAPERAAIRQPRMPAVEDLPQPGQQLVRAQEPRAEAATMHPVESKRMTLMQRLAAVGLGRREDGVGAAPVPVTPPVAVATPAPSATHAEYARRPAAPVQRAAAGHLDPMGRVANQAGNSADEQLEIPAFLRRQAN
ncbi:MAG: cell division protein FtsZ [Proteobacteria bacterium]|nr:cell division protein FtsZ [Pseudomonadota bacterium]